MNKTLSYIVIFFTIGIILSFFGEIENFDLKRIEPATMAESLVLCSGNMLDSGRCTGSVYCTACTNCKYCKHCKGGGSCGVCGKKIVRKKRKATSRIKSQNNGMSQTNYHSKSNLTPKGNKLAQFTRSGIIIQKTSLRDAPNSKSKVILRFRAGDEVTILKECNDWWCKVLFEADWLG